MQRLVEEYLVFLHETKQVSDNTYASYKRDLKKLAQYLMKDGNISVLDIDDTMIQSYMDHLKEQGYASTTITRSFIAIKSFFKFLCHKNYLENNPSNHIKLPKATGKKNDVLTREEMKTLLTHPVVFSFKGLRDRAMLLLLYETKMSISELVKLKAETIDFERSILICGKDGRKKEFVLNNETKESLAVYVNYKKFAKDDWLFPNRYGKPMSRQGFWKTIKNYAKEVGIDKDITLFAIKQGEI